MEGAPQPPAPHQAGPAEDAAADRQRQAAQHPLESMLQMGLRAAFGGMGGVQGAAPQMPQVFLQMGGRQGQWEDFVREAMDAQGGGGDRLHPASKQAIRDMRKGDAHPPPPGSLHVRFGGKCRCSPADGADELAEACSICQDDFAEGDKWVQMPCGHFFHGDCLMPWLKEHNTCPTCRATVDEEPQPAAVPAPPPPVQPAADGPDEDGREQLLPDDPALGHGGPQPGMMFGQGMFPPGMFVQQRRAAGAEGGGASAVHDVLQAFQQTMRQQTEMNAAAQQQQQQQAAQQWQQWISRLDQAAAAGTAAGEGARAPQNLDFRQLFGGLGLRNENVVHHLQQQQAEEERQLQAAIEASMAEEEQRATTERHDSYTADDLGQLGVRALKEFLDERSVVYSHCVEKSELLAEARRALSERGDEREVAREADAVREAAELEEAIRLSMLEGEGGH